MCFVPIIWYLRAILKYTFAHIYSVHKVKNIKNKTKIFSLILASIFNDVNNT